MIIKNCGIIIRGVLIIKSDDGAAWNKDASEGLALRLGEDGCIRFRADVHIEEDERAPMVIVNE